MDAKDRSFDLPSLLGMIALFAVSLGLMRLGYQFPETVALPVFGVIGALWLIAGLGAVIGLLLAGKQGVVPGAIVMLLAALFVFVVSCAGGWWI